MRKPGTARSRLKLSADALAASLAALLTPTGAVAQEELRPYTIVDDAIPASLTLPGIPQTADVASSWARIVPPL